MAHSRLIPKHQQRPLLAEGDVKEDVRYDQQVVEDFMEKAVFYDVMSERT